MSGIPTERPNSDASSAAHREPRRLPRRDWWLLPLLSLATILAISFSLRMVASVAFKDSKSPNSCLVMDDPTTGVRAVPNSVCWKKSPESLWSEYRFNHCGHRAGMECGPKPPGHYRIVLMGSSFGFGMWVPREKSFAALLPGELSASTGKNVEVYNESMQWSFPASAALRFNEVLAAQPDMILWDLTPIDVQYADEILPPTTSHAAGGEGWWRRHSSEFADHTFSDAVSHTYETAIRKLIGSADKLLEHAIYAGSHTQYVKSALAGPDSDIGFLKASPSAAWQAHLQQFDHQAAIIEAKARAAGVPIVVVLLPNRLQVAMISGGEWPSDYDPYKLDHDLKEIVERHGGTFIDVLQEFRTMNQPERDFYPLDGHPDPEGHALFSKVLAKELTSGAVPALTPSVQQQASLNRRR